MSGEQVVRRCCREHSEGGATGVVGPAHGMHHWTDYGERFVCDGASEPLLNVEEDVTAADWVKARMALAKALGVSQLEAQAIMDQARGEPTIMVSSAVEPIMRSLLGMHYPAEHTHGIAARHQEILAGLPPVPPMPMMPTDYVPSTAGVPLREPRKNTRAIGVFIVTCIGTEPPPDWNETTLHVLRKEVGFCLGKNARVERFPEFSTVRQVVQVIKAMVADAGGTTEELQHDPGD